MCGRIQSTGGRTDMRDSKLSRRDMLRASTVLTTGAVFAEPLAAAAPEPTPLRPAMIQAARKEGTLAFYTAMAIPVAENLCVYRKLDSAISVVKSSEYGPSRNDAKA